MRAAAALAIAAACGLAAGCAERGDFPSLARRAVELDRSVEEPVRTPVEVPSEEALRVRVAELRGRAAAGDRAFEAAYGWAAAAVGAAGRRGSDGWTTAQQALSRLEATREPTMRAMSELDALIVERAGTPTNSGDFASINAAVAAVERMAVAQQQRFDRLRDRLNGR
ncbi:MAG TPA: hypothetical protein VF704_09050 [Allosphingosinicella sp.]|jgi:hypothetical protein